MKTVINVHFSLMSKSFFFMKEVHTFCGIICHECNKDEISINKKTVLRASD